MHIDVNHILDDGTVAVESNADGAYGSLSGGNFSAIKLPAANYGFGESVYVEGQLMAAFNNRTSVTFSLQDSSDGTTWTDLFKTGAKTIATDLATARLGKKVFQFELPTEHKQYLRMAYTGTGGTANSTGKIFVHIPVAEELTQ